ncbi:mucin-like protein [Oculina patagonica]
MAGRKNFAEFATFLLLLFCLASNNLSEGSDTTSSSSSASVSSSPSSSSSLSASASSPSVSTPSGGLVCVCSSPWSSSSSSSASQSSSSSSSVPQSSSSSASVSQSDSSSSSASQSDSSSSSSASQSDSSSPSSASQSSSSSASVSQSSSPSASVSRSDSSSPSVSQSDSSSSSASHSSSPSASVSQSSSPSASVSQSDSSSSSASQWSSSSAQTCSCYYTTSGSSSSVSTSPTESLSSSTSMTSSSISESSVSISSTTSESVSMTPAVAPDPCSSLNCSDHGNCTVNNNGTAECVCDPGFEGSNCEIDIDECNSTPCLNNGTCIDGINSYSCNCSVGLFGDICSDDPCAALDCGRYGDCMVNNNRTAECHCDPGFKGLNCEININECNAAPCQNNGTCVDGINSYSCNCADGFFGKNCSHVDPCYNSDPCKNDGKCHVAEDFTFFCVCPIPKAYTGVDCGTPIDCFWDKMYPYGEEQEDEELDVVNIRDGLCVKIDYGNGLYFYDVKRYKLFICANGMIRFDDGFERYEPIATFDVNEFPFYIPMLFPYWAKIDIHGSFCFNSLNPSDPLDCKFDYVNRSSVFYQFYTENSNSPNASYILDRANQEVRNNPQFSSFSASSVLVVTWLRLRPEEEVEGDVQEGTTNTFQAVLVTDGTYTFLKYHYPCGALQWASPEYYELNPNEFIGYPAAGFNAGDNKLDPDRFPSLDGSGNQNVKDLDEKVGNKGIIGEYFFRIETREGDDFDTQCRKWFTWQQDNLLNDINIYSNFLPVCPCSLFQAIDETKFLRSFDETSPSILCYKSRRRIPISNPVSTRVSRKCCYSISPHDFAALIVDGLDAGSVEVSYVNRPDNVLDDSAAKGVCCNHSTNCDKFFEARPSDRCFGYRPPRRRWFWGDPHFKTLDDKNYTFNGIGEYTMLDAENGSFILQARTVLAPGNRSIATVFSAGAAEELETSRVEVRAKNGGGLELYIDGTLYAGYNDLTSDSKDIGGNLTAARKTDKCVEVGFQSGSRVEFCEDKGLMTFVVTLDDIYFDKTKGLLGTFNDNPDDDFTLPNGTVLSSSLSSSQIHYDFGLNWQITDAESLFTYGPNENVSTFANASFEPMFVENIKWADNATREAAETACGSDVVCLFDAASTNDVTIGTNSKDVNVQLVKENEALENFPPWFTYVPTMIEANLGEIVFVNVTTTDNNSFTFDVLNKPQGASLSPAGNLLNFTWNVTSSDKVKFTFIATDEFNASVISTPTVKMCSCRNGGQCVAPELGDELNDDSKFIVQGCTCAAGYTGRFCESDIDACSFNGNPCFRGVNCTDQPAPADTTGFTCGPCPSGYSGDGIQCSDINECQNSSLHNCQQECVNNPGSFICKCNPGFTLNANGHSCDDINECEPTSDCMHQCNNTDGSYSCYCNEFFEIDPNDPKSCKPIIACPPSNDCSQVCFINQDNNQVCDCNAGFKLDNDGKTCNDIDECQIDGVKCTQTCNNTIGGYHCQCYPGFTLDADGFTCTDINECLASNLYSCPGQFRVCVNIPGNYTCECQNGLYYINNTCQALLPGEKPPDPTVPAPKEASANEIQNSVEIRLANMTKSQYTAAVDKQFREACAKNADNYCQQNKTQCGITSKRRRRATQIIIADNVHLLPGFPVEENSFLRVAFYILLPSFLQSSGVIPAAALVHVVNNAKSELQTVFGVPISEITKTYVPTTTGPPANATNVTTSQPTTQPATISTTETESDDWKWIVIGVVVGVVVIVIIIVVVVLVIRRKRSSKRLSSSPDENDNARGQGEWHEMATYHMEGR